MEAAAVSAQSGSLWYVVVHRPWIWIDVVLLVALLAIQILTYLSRPTASSNPVATASALSSGASGGLTVVGILLPLSLLAIQLRTSSSSVKLSSSALADFFVASVWLVGSLAAGLYVLFSASIRGPREDVSCRRDIGILFGAQLFLLFAGAFRLVWAISSIIGVLLRTKS